MACPSSRKATTSQRSLTLFLIFKTGMCSVLPAQSSPSLRAVSGIWKAIIPTIRPLEIARNVGKDPRFVQAVLDESEEVLLDRPFLLVATRFGHVAVNAGIDQSNVGEGRILLLPQRPQRQRQKAMRQTWQGLRSNHHRHLRQALSRGRCWRGHWLGWHCSACGIGAGRRTFTEKPWRSHSRP